ncbi:ATP-grasp fold amidoligase family protein [Vagococcus fluvialis]|uniref:ATP-grasp fold amidoligase family protein n=1 Tax=Vagococcus fluvialis TaxID=2738 RepID=UPI0022E1F06F|nr:ATP-grasp fold amidoligase family protein [Vagococcus fluvialis]
MKTIVKKCLPSKLCVKLQFKRIFGRKIDFNKLVLFNEKLQQIKLFDKNPLYPTLVDKIKVKDYVIDIYGDEIIIPTLGSWNSFDEIDFDSLPEKFVLKCNHDSGSYIIVKDKKKMNMDYAREKLTKALKKNHYDVGKEWAYKNVKPKIMAEVLLEEKEGIQDYKFYCFDGKVDCMMVCSDREKGNTKFHFFDRDWNFLEYDKKSSKENDFLTVKKPNNFNEMINVAEKLARGLKFVRLDLYCVNEKIYFSEYTLYPASGYDNSLTMLAEENLGKKIVL